MTSSLPIYTSSTQPQIVIKRFLEGPKKLQRTLAKLELHELDNPPAEGGWTIREIVHHVVDGDYIWNTAVRIAVGLDQAEFSLGWYWSHTQTQWAKSWGYSRRPLEESLSLLKANRNHIAQLLTTIPDSWARSVSVRDSKGILELVTVGFIVEMQANHLLHHLKRIIDLHKHGGGA